MTGPGSASTTAAHRPSGLQTASSSPGASAKTAAISGSSARPDHRATVRAATSPPPTALNITAA